MEAGSKFFAILCNNAVVELVLNKPNALRRSPCDRHASTAAVKKTFSFINMGHGARRSG